MAKDPAPSQVTTNALQSLPFDNIIGGLMEACIETQSEQAKATAKFMKEVGLVPDKEAEEKE